MILFPRTRALVDGIIYTEKVLKGLNEAGLRILGVRQCEFVEDGFACKNLVSTKHFGDRPDSIYGRFCGDCLINEFGKGE